MAATEQGDADAARRPDDARVIVPANDAMTLAGHVHDNGHSVSVGGRVWVGFGVPVAATTDPVGVASGVSVILGVGFGVGLGVGAGVGVTAGAVGVGVGVGVGVDRWHDAVKVTEWPLEFGQSAVYEPGCPTGSTFVQSAVVTANVCE